MSPIHVLSEVSETSWLKGLLENTQKTVGKELVACLHLKPFGNLHIRLQLGNCAEMLFCSAFYCTSSQHTDKCICMRVNSSQLFVLLLRLETDTLLAVGLHKE